MTAHFESEESHTLFNSLEEGGQGIFSLMVDPRSVVERGSTVEPEVRVGQELRVAIRPDSVSPVAHDVSVVWSNGFEGPAYLVRPEDVGTDLFALARFAGVDMRPLEVKIECGNVLRGAPVVIDPAAIMIFSSEERIAALAPVYVRVPAGGLDAPVDSLEVSWLIDGEPSGEPTPASFNEDAQAYDAQVTLADHQGGQVLSVVIRASRAGREDGLVTVNAGLIGSGKQMMRDQDAEIRVTSPRVGRKSKIVVDPASFTPLPEQLTFQWLIDGNEIAGATKTKFRPAPAQRGRKLSVFITAEHSEHLPLGIDVYLGEVATGLAPEYLGAPLVLKGKAQPGGKLRVANLEQELFDLTPSAIEYQWMRGKKAIAGAREKKYEPGAADVGKKVWARLFVKVEGHRTTVLTTEKVRIR